VGAHGWDLSTDGNNVAKGGTNAEWTYTPRTTSYISQGVRNDTTNMASIIKFRDSSDVPKPYVTLSSLNQVRTSYAFTHLPIHNNGRNVTEMNVTEEGVIWSGQCKQPNYFDSEWSSRRALQRDSLYRFGCRFKNTLGLWSKIYWIGDIRTPSQQSAILRLFNFNSNGLFTHPMG